MQLKNARHERISEYTAKFGGEYLAGKRPWVVPCECAFPSATQNEIEAGDAMTLLKNGCTLVSEGANMPSTPDAVRAYLEGGILYGPGKAANAGGVATSGLEMAQNATRMSWSREEVDQRLRRIMMNIHENCRN